MRDVFLFGNVISMKEDSKLLGPLTRRSYGRLKLRLLEIKNIYLHESFHIHYKMYNLVN